MLAALALFVSAADGAKLKRKTGGSHTTYVGPTTAPAEWPPLVPVPRTTPTSVIGPLHVEEAADLATTAPAKAAKGAVHATLEADASSPQPPERIVADAGSPITMQSDVVVNFLQTEQDAVRGKAKSERSERPTVIYMLGAPGMGKSVAQKFCVEEMCKDKDPSCIHSFTAIDPDEVLKHVFNNDNKYYWLPEAHKADSASNLADVHNVNTMRLTFVKDQLANYINDGTGRNMAYYHGAMAESKERGYKVVLCGVTGNNPLAIDQARARGKATGRHVDIEYMTKTVEAVSNSIAVYTGVEKTTSEGKELDFNLLIDRVLIYDNLVLGGNPELRYDFTATGDEVVGNRKLVRTQEHEYESKIHSMTTEVAERVRNNINQNSFDMLKKLITPGEGDTHAMIGFLDAATIVNNFATSTSWKRLISIYGKDAEIPGSGSGWRSLLNAATSSVAERPANGAAAAVGSIPETYIFGVPIGLQAAMEVSQAEAFSKVFFEAAGIKSNEDVPGFARNLNIEYLSIIAHYTYIEVRLFTTYSLHLQQAQRDLNTIWFHPFHSDKSNV